MTVLYVLKAVIEDKKLLFFLAECTKDLHVLNQKKIFPQAGFEIGELMVQVTRKMYTFEVNKIKT